MGKFSTDYSRESVFSSSTHPKMNNVVLDAKFTQLKSLMKELEDKYHLSSKEIIDAVEKPTINIPLSIYSNKTVSALEATTLYLKDSLNLKYSQIAKLLNRDERTVWSTYNNASKKITSDLVITGNKTLPIEVISKRDYSILESITCYLKEEKELKYSEIAVLLSLDQRTVWTCYSRLQKKRGDKK